MSLNFQATRFQCTWPWDMLVMLCDGRIVCGCADPLAKRVLGDARTTTIEGIWRGEKIRGLREEMNQAGSDFCGDCPLKLPLEPGQEPTIRSLEVGRHPGRMFIECTAACNISCSQAICAPETGITKTRQAGMLDFDVFKRVIDEVGPSLGRIDFFNYGEAFLHKRAVEMCEYIKANHPHIYLYTSTNGGAFNEEQARRLVHSGIDEVTWAEYGEDLAAGRIKVVAAFGMKKHKDLENVPLFPTGATEEERKLFALMYSRQVIGRPFAAPQDVPKDRLDALRNAYAATVKDANFLAEAAKFNIDIDPVYHDELNELIAELYATPQSIIDRMQSILKAAN